jgi:hypothetical protein
MEVMAMRIRVLATVMALTGMSSWGERLTLADYTLTVCMNAGPNAGGWGAALPQASEIFGEIGIRIDWRYRPHDCDAVQGIVVTLSEDQPRTKYQDAFAYAQPYEGIHIEVFYDRIREKMRSERAPLLLAHVLAHEVAHILQGIDRHSRAGIMKAVWGEDDYFDMVRGRMKFTQYDIDLIRLGFDSRKARVAAKNQRGAYYNDSKAARN